MGHGLRHFDLALPQRVMVGPPDNGLNYIAQRLLGGGGRGAGAGTPPSRARHGSLMVAIGEGVADRDGRAGRLATDIELRGDCGGPNRNSVSSASVVAASTSMVPTVAGCRIVWTIQALNSASANPAGTAPAAILPAASMARC